MSYTMDEVQNVGVSVGGGNAVVTVPDARTDKEYQLYCSDSPGGPWVAVGGLMIPEFNGPMSFGPVDISGVAQKYFKVYVYNK